MVAGGCAVLETTCNPYVLALGDESTAVRRLNFAQMFNPVGSLVGLLLALALRRVLGNLAVGLLEVRDLRLQFCRVLHFKVCGLRLGDARLQTLDGLADLLQLRLVGCEVPLVRLQIVDALLLHAVAAKNLLLLRDEFLDGNRLVRHIVVIRHVGCRLLLLLGHAPHGGARVVLRLLLALQFRQFVADAENLQEDVGLLLVLGKEELRQVDCQLADHGVEDGLPVPLAVLVGDGEVGVLALALDHEAVISLDVDDGIGNRALAAEVRRLVLLAAQSVGNAVEDGCLALCVLPANDREAVGGRFKANRPDSLHVLHLKGGYFHCSLPFV